MTGRVHLTRLRGTILDGTPVAQRGEIVIQGGRIVEIQRNERYDDPFYLIPGLVDIHVHGALGSSFNSPRPQDWRRVMEAHAMRGTMFMALTVATAPWTDLLAALDAGQSLAEERLPGFLGVHLEGPFLSESHRGAHPADALVDPAPERLDDLSSRSGTLSLLTLAPERSQARQLVEWARRDGIACSVGHSSVSRLPGPPLAMDHVAHLWSGQSRLSINGGHRETGLVEAVLASDDITAEVLADGHHVTAEMLHIAYRCLGPDRLCLVSDASSGMGLPSGSSFRMGSVVGMVGDGVAHAVDGQALCGSTVGLLDVVRFAVSSGVPPVDAVRMATTTPGAVIGWDRSEGPLAVGTLAAVLVVTDRFELVKVVCDWIPDLSIPALGALS